MKIKIDLVPTSSDCRIGGWVRQAMLGLKLTTISYDSDWIRFGAVDLKKGNFYTVRFKDLWAALKEKNSIAARELAFSVSSEIKTVLIEKSLCKEISD